MIRNMIKVGTVSVSDGATEPLEIDIKHKGTFGRFMFQGWNGADLCAGTALADAIAKLSLTVTQNNNDSFALLNNVTTGYLKFRHLFHYASLGLENAASMLHYDPAAGVGKDEGRRNQLTLGTKDLDSMVFDFQFAAATVGCSRIDVWADVDYNLVQNLGEHIRIGSQSALVPGTGGDVEISTVPFGSKNLCLNAFHLEEPTDLTVKEWTIAVNSKQFPYLDVRQDVINAGLEFCYRTPQTGFASIDFNKEDVPAYFFESGLGSLLVTPEFEAAAEDTAAANCRLWYEQIYKAAA